MIQADDTETEMEFPMSKPQMERRPFTPPFAQIAQAQQREQQKVVQAS